MVLDGKVEFRKLQVTGGSTFIVSLPKNWIKANNLNPSDIVSVEQLPSGEVQISPHEVKETKRIVKIDLTKYPPDALYDCLVGAYVSGADKIIVKDPDGISSKNRRLIRQFLRDTRGMEISDDEPKILSIISLLNPNELPLQVSLNRMYLLVTSLVDDALAVLGGEDADLLSDYDDRERQVDARRLLIDRQVAMVLQNHQLEREIGINRYTAMEHSVMAHYFERMGDHANTLARIITEMEGELKLSIHEAPLSYLPIWLGALRDIVRNMYSKEIRVLTDGKSNLEKAISALGKHEEKLMSTSKQRSELLVDFRISEITRRLCGYTIDMTETLINMLLSSRTKIGTEGE
ncbi:MAG: PhoU domain-containing protein [Poseidonia sp.]